LKFNGHIPGVQPPDIRILSPKYVEKKLDNGHWKFDVQMGTNGYVGFVYVIFDTYLKRAYIGKKSFVSNTKLHGRRESDWRKYATSSGLMGELLKQRPKEEFEFVCLDQYKTKGTLSYAETWSLCFVEAPTSNIFYNTRIESVSWSVKEPISDKHKAGLNKLLKDMELT
jgi:hypothetical protein